jgi:hypothetical protein
MQDWQIESAKALGLAFVAFLGGSGTNWLTHRPMVVAGLLDGDDGRGIGS